MAGDMESRGRDLGLLLLRIGLGVVFLGHGLQKFGLFDSGSYPSSISGQADLIALFGYSSTTVLAWLVTISELVAGVSLLLGVFTPLGGSVLIGIGLQFVAGLQWQGGLFGNADMGGFEFSLIMVVSGCALALAGAGRYGLEKRLRLERFSAWPLGMVWVGIGALVGLGVLIAFGPGLGG